MFHATVFSLFIIAISIMSPFIMKNCYFFHFDMVALTRDDSTSFEKQSHLTPKCECKALVNWHLLTCHSEVLA